jgi:hypothetical protein
VGVGAETPDPGATKVGPSISRRRPLVDADIEVSISDSVTVCREERERPAVGGLSRGRV